MSEKKQEKTEKPAEMEERNNFIDAFYHSRDESPAAPHVYGSSSPEHHKEKTIQRPAAVATVCAGAALLGLLLGYSRIQSARMETQEPAEETEAAAPLFSLEPEESEESLPDGESSSEDGAYLGIVAQTVSAAVVSYYNWENAGVLVEGARICAVESGSAAEKAGLKTGDIIISVGADAVHSEQELASALELCRAGKQTTVTYYRDGKTFLTTVLPGSRAEENEPEKDDYFSGFEENRRR